MVMNTPILFLSILENLGLNVRIGVWIILILSAFYIWRLLDIGSKVSSWLVILAVSLVIIGAGLALGVIQGIDVDRFFGILQAVIGFVWAIVQRVIGGMSNI